MTEQEFNLRIERKVLFERRKCIYDGNISDFDLEKEIEKQDEEFIRRLKEEIDKMQVEGYYENGTRQILNQEIDKLAGIQ